MRKVSRWAEDLYVGVRICSSSSAVHVWNLCAISMYSHGIWRMVYGRGATFPYEHLGSLLVKSKLSAVDFVTT
jgi:hypothetical protein